MDKQQLIALIQRQLATGTISREDLLLVANSEVAPPASTPPFTYQANPSAIKEESSKNLINTFYGIGAIVVLVGIGILVEQNWTVIGFMGRILVTMGIALLTYICGFTLNKPSQKVISQVMFTLSCALAPLGAYVLLNEARIDFVWPQTFYTAAILCLLYGYALMITKKNILLLITMGFGSWAYYALAIKIFGFDYGMDLLKWAVMLLGVSYIFISYGYQSNSVSTDIADEREKKAVQNTLYGFGTLAILGAGISIGGIFDLIFIAVIFATFYGSVYFKSQAMLVFASLFLMAHIVKLTSKYFVDSIGWPIALIIVGFLIIGIGYLAYDINKKYIVSH